MAGLSLSDDALLRAIQHAVSAQQTMLTGNRARPTSGFESLTGIAGEVDLYLRGLQVARAALADAAMTAGQGLRQVMEDASTLDGALAASLDADFAVRGRS